VNGVEIDRISDGATIKDLNWRDIANNPFEGGGYGGGDLPAGEPVTVRAENTSVSGGGFEIDVIALVDNEYTYNFDNDNGGNDGFLDGPQLYPDFLDISLTTAETRRNVTEARFASSWNDTSEDQFVELSNDGNNFTRITNSDSGSVTFASPESGVDANIRLSRFGSRTTATPQTGFNGQRIDSWQLFANPDAVLPDDINEAVSRGVVPPNTITGETIREAGLLSGSTLLTRHVLAEFDVLADQRLASSETTTFTGTE